MFDVLGFAREQGLVWVENFNLPEVDQLEFAEMGPDLPGSPESLTWNSPEVVGTYFELNTRATPGDLGLDPFVKGALCMALAASEDTQRELTYGITCAVELATEKGYLPGLSPKVREAYLEVVEKVFANGEPMTWLSLCGFVAGTFWAAGCFRGPDRKRKRFKVSPIDIAVRIASQAATNAYLPQ